MARWDCTRCKVVYFDSDGEHVCADIKARLTRRNKQANAVTALLNEYFPNDNPDPEFRTHIAREIVTRLVSMGVDND